MDNSPIDPGMMSAPEATPPPPIMDDDPKPPPPSGIRGWLLLFCFIVLLLAPFRLLVEASEAGWLAAAFDVALALFSVYVGICLVRQSRRALPLLKAYFIVLLGLALLVVAAGVAVALFVLRPATAILQLELAYSGVQTAVFVGIWWMYFRRSRRVRYTYGRNL